MSKYEFDGDKVKKLYGAMQKLGYQQSLGEFEKGFYGKDNYQKRKAVYDVMTENGADLGSSYEDFIGRMRATGSSGGVSKSAIKPTNKAPKTHFSEEPWAQKSKEAKRAAAVLDGGFDALTRAAEVSSDEDFRKNPLNKLVSERVEDPKSKRLVTKPKKYSVPESDVREGGSMVRMVDAYKTVDGKAVSIPSAATSTQGNENQDEDFATQYISGKIDRKEYKKKAKAKDGEAAIANFQSTMEGDEEFLYRTDKRYKEYRDKILNGDGDIDELSPETKAWYLERVEARIKDAEERQEKYLSVINSYEHQKNLEENNNDFWRNFGQVRGGIGAAGREQAKAMLRETDYTEEMDLANAGLGATESELTDLHALRDMLKGKDVGFFRRVKDHFGNRNNLTFGFQEAADNATLIANKNSKNPLLSSAAESKAKESEAATMYSRSANLRAKAGSVTAEMLPFVIEMASAGSMTSVAGKAAHKAVYSLGTRMLKSAALKGMEEGLLKATGTAALKVGTRGLSWIAHGLTAGALQTVTAGAGETAANITGRMVGQGAKQEDGSYAFEGGEGAVGAVLHGFTSQLIENATEFMGGGLGYGVGKVASKLTKPLAKVGLGGVTDFFGRIAASPISKATSKTLSKFQIQGIPEEIGEEYLGWAGHSMAGDGDAEWSDFADFQKHKELWATMALSVGAMGAFAASGHVPSLLKRRGRSLKMADRAAAGAFSDEEKWNALRDKLDGTDNNNVLRSLYDNVMQDKSLNGRERKAAMLYAGNLLAYRGANLGAIAGKRLALEQKRSNAEDARRAAMVEGAAPSGAESVDEHALDGDDVVSSAFRQGYEETSAANAYLWAKALEEQEGHAMEVLGLTEKELNEKFSPQNAGETLNEIRGAKEGAYTEEQKKAAFDYANTRAAYEGVVERTQDDIDSEIAYHHAIVDRQTNIDSGRLHPVKLFTSEKNKRDDAFLVSGRLAFEYNDKGEPVVSTRLSDPTLIVSDAAGRTRMVSPSEIADAEDSIDVDEYKNTLAEHVRQEMEERKYAEMLKAAEESQANEVEEGEPESPAVDGLSTSEEEKETPKVNEDREQSSVFSGAFNVGDKFSTEDGAFEVVQLTEGEAPIVQNVETGQQFRPHSEGDLRAAVQSYTPAFIDGAENTEGVTTYNRVAQKETAPQDEAQEGSQQEQEYALSDIISARGERFYADAEGNINLSQIPEKVLNVLELPNVPLRLTESMIEHIVVRHGKELSITSAEQAVRFVVDVMKRFDHVRKGNKKGTFVFSIENGRNKTGRRAVTLVVPEVQTEDTNPSPQVDNSSFLGVVTSGYESIEGLQKREILWEEGASVAPTAETASANVPTPSATQGGMTGGSASNQSISYREDTQSSAGVQENTDISLENVQSALDKGEIAGVTPQMAHDALYNDPDLETEEVDAIVENSRSTAQGNLAKLQKAEIKPRKNESVIAFKKRKAAHAGALAHAEELVRFWEEVQEHRRNLGAQAMQEEENVKQQREAEAAERAKEQAENGLAVAPSWANAEKIVGRPGEFITPNGLRVKGHYVLVESGAAVPSHDARHGFKQSEGFPTDEKGHTLNDRDYERDLDAQRVQREIARNYDARATQQPVVVSPEGFVLSGNGRTMSGDLAAMENTDGAYNSYVREYPEMWGFTSDQVEKFEHPRVVFVSDNPLPLTTETFAAFNAQETKTQSRTEKAVKMGKAVSDEDFAKILRIVTDGHETLSDFYSNANAAAEALNVLETSGVITQQDRANLFDGDVLSDEGRNLLENVLLGKAFEGNPDVVRQLSEVRSLRTSVLNALFYIVENERLNEEFHLSNELSRAINFVYHARKGGGYSFGDKVRTFAQQTELFESTTDVTLDDATVLLLADALNDKRTILIKSIFKSYNERAEDAGRGQMSLFGDALPSRDTLIMETLALLGVDIKDYAPSNQVESSNQETNEQQQEPKQQQQPEAGTSESTSEQGAEGKTETELPSGSVSTSGRGNEGVSTEKKGAQVDSQGNPLREDGTLAIEHIDSINELTDADFLAPTRNVSLPDLPKRIADALGANGKRVVIKRNIFERNKQMHGDLTPEQSRGILSKALYHPTLYGQNQKVKRPYNWVVISTGEKGKRKLVLLEVSNSKENIEIVHWHFIDEHGLNKIRRQAEREDGQLLILPSESDSEEVGALSDPTQGLSSDGKNSDYNRGEQGKGEKNKAGTKLTTRQRVTKAKERGGREWIDSLRTTTDSHYLRLATDVGYISAPEAQAIIRNPHTKDDVLKLLLRKLEANYFDLYQTDVAEEMARRNLSAEDLQRLYDVVMKDPRAYRFYNALDAIAQNKNTPESVLDELYKRAIKEGRRLDKDGNYVDLGLRLAQNPSMSESHLRTLALTHGEDVAKNPSAPVDLLRVFATEKKSPYGSYYALRAAVAQNPSTPADLLLEILRTSDREEAAVEYVVKHPNLKGADLERAAELSLTHYIFSNPNVTDELLEKWANNKDKSKKAKVFASLAKMKLDERRASKAEEGKAHLTKSQRELLELVRNPNATAEELQRAYEGEYYDEDDAKQVKKAKELAKVRNEVVRAIAAHPNAPSTILYEIYYSEGEEDPELQRIIESRKDDTIGEDILGSKPNGRIREQRVEKSDVVVGQTVYFRNMPMPWKVEAISSNGKLTITTEISGHVLRHENILQRWVSLSPVEEKQSDKELSHANNTVSEEQGDTKPARESNSEDLNSTESRDKEYADAVARGDFETAERMLAEEAERKGYSLDSPYQGESAFNGKAPSDSGYYENAEERKKAYDEGDYEGDWTLADELVRGVDMGALVDFRLSDNELHRANDMTRESILNLREALRKARSGEKNITIKMYRSVPPGVKEREFRNGDWITPSRLYALDNAEIHGGYEGENQEGWNGGYRIIEQEVPIEDVWWDGNDVNEWGYDNGEREAYRNTENNRKAFSVTYDREGNLIPLSKRFDETNSDARYSKGEEQRVSNENALDGVSPEQIELRDGLVDIMREAGMDVSVSDAEGQRVLDMARGAMAETDAVREEREDARFVNDLARYERGEMKSNERFSLGMPRGIAREFLPELPIEMSQRVLRKSVEKKHSVPFSSLGELMSELASPIMVFQRADNAVSFLTEIKDEQGRNVLVAIELNRKEQKGGDVVEVNDIRSLHGRDIQNIVLPIIENETLRWINEEKGSSYLSSASYNSQQEIDKKNLSRAANIIKGFENPKLSGEILRQQRKNSITEELQSIKTKAQSEGTFMLAPNGEPTNLTERQWLQVRTEAFKEWFGDWENDPEEASQMKDENGEPKVFYHNTNADFFAFNPLYNGSSTDAGWLGDGFYFYGDPSEGQNYGEKKMSVFLNIREPYYASEEENRSLSEQNDRSASLEFREERESEGYDGVYFNGDLRQETVVFSPSQIKSATDNVGAFDKENDDIRFYRGQHGEVRGFAVGGRIYLDPKMASDETAIHEYTHLWADALRRVNPAEWENVKDLLRGTPIWEETKRLYPELADDEDALADEVLAQFSGKHGAKRLAEAREKAMSEADGVFDKAKVASVFDNVRQALKRFWKGVADFLGLHFTSAEEVADKVLSDLLNGVNPNDVIVNTKDSIREQRIDKDTREEMQRSVDELRVEVREGYEKAVKDWKYKMQEQWQDSMLALKTLQDELEKKGVKIEEWENAYWAENRMSSMNEEEMKAYTRDYFKPIVAVQIAASKALPQELTDKLNAMDAHLREFGKMNAEEKKRNAVDNYLMLKHGLERNRVLAMRDAIDAQWENPSEASSVWRAYNEDAGNRENRRLLQEGKRSFEEFLQVDDAIRAHYAGEEYLKNREKDYSGLTSMTTEELTELKDVENAALQLVKEAEDAAGAELSALWDKVNKATRESVEKLYKSGLLTPAAYSQMTTMFQWYVPLRGFAEETSDEVYDYVDQRNGNGMGAMLKGADGRKSKADSPIAHIGSMAERSIVQGNRNLMKQHFYRMVMNHPNDLVSMGEIYLHHNEVTDEWEMMTPTHSPNATPEQIAEETRAFEERMQELVKQEPDNYLRLRERPDVPYRVLGSNLGEHQVLVKVLGRDKLLTVNGDPRVAQAVNGRFNPDAAQSLAGKSVRALNRVLAQMATQSNPEFIFRNMFRDRSYAMKASLVKDGVRYWRRLELNWVVGLGQVIGLSKRYEDGTLNMNNELDKTFHEFMMNGGATGVTHLLNPEDYKGEITDIAKDLQRGKYSLVKLAKLMKKYVDFFGSCSEIITRFAAYRTSREMGRSVERAVWDAKEISTNFNKKGAGSKALRKNDGLLVRTSGELASFFRNYIIFTNANIQGFHNQWQIAKKHPLRFALNFAVRGLFTGFVMTLANRLLASAFGDDDDRYMDLPESARRSNLCFFVPGLGWVKFPLGFNYRSFYGLGGLMAERVFMPDESYESFMKSALSLALDMLPLSIRDGEQPLWLDLVPSGVRPMAEVAVNEDWSGRPIVNEYTNENWPEYRRANNHTGYISTKISQGLNYLTGGDEYTPGFINLNPSSMEHIALGLLSGVGTLVGNSFETGSALWHDEKLDTQHIPFLRDFLARNNQIIHASSVKHNFYALKDEYEKTKVRVLGYEREEADGKNDPESVARRVDFTQNSAEYKRYEVMDEAVSEVNSLRNDLKEATTPEEVKALEAEMQQVMEDAINDVRAIK